MKRIGLILIGAAIGVFLLVRPVPVPEEVAYGVSFSKLHAEELGLDWRQTYRAILDDLGVKRLRLSAHWTMIQPREGVFSWTELDYQMSEARRRGVSVILGVGRRLPNFPECHEPDWVQELEESEKRQAVLDMVRAVVERYRNYENIRYWQVENESHLTTFAREHCGGLDELALDLELKLVRELDPDRQILMTDSGEFGRWWPAWNRGDVFGTTMYLYVWNQRFGKVRYPIDAWFFRAKQRLAKLLLQDKPVILAELGTEPWLLTSIVEAPLDVQLERMGLDKMREMLDVAGRSGFDETYLWGAEWWYWLVLQGREEHWEFAKELF
jgi:hypothetical protein